MKLMARVCCAAGLFVSTAIAQADSYQEHNYAPFGCCHLPCAPEPCCHEAPACGVAYNPPAYFNCDCPQNCSFWENLRFKSDFLWWRACEEGLALGVEETFELFPNGAQAMESKLKEPDFHYDPGFRIGLATVCDCWDAALNWTYFHTKASVSGKSEGELSRVTGGEVTSFISAWERDPNLNIPEIAKGKWSLSMDWLDLEFGRKFFAAKCFIVRPFFGLRGARVDQGYRTNAYSNIGINSISSFVSNVKAKSNFLGLGPRLGFDLELHLPCCLKLFAQAAGALVFGRTQRHANEHLRNIHGEVIRFGVPDELEFKSHSTLDRCSHAITDLLIGLKWEHCCNWCNREHPITIAFSWEFHNLYGFNRFIFDQNLASLSFEPYQSIRGDQIFGSSKSGSISTQGLTVSAEIGF